MRRYPLPLATMLSVALAVAGALGPPAVVQAAPTADARIVVEATNGQLKALKGKVFDKACNESVDYDATVIDLNGDGQPEVFTNLYGTCVGGMAGVFMQLYIKDANGQWEAAVRLSGAAGGVEVEEPRLSRHRGGRSGHLLSGLALERQGVCAVQEMPVAMAQAATLMTSSPHPPSAPVHRAARTAIAGA
ncbi:hypothetical protein ACU4HD_29400 [Cupriavidus basilensis]